MTEQLSSLSDYGNARRNNWDKVATELSSLSSVRNYYHNRLIEVFCLNITEGARILELGCGTGDLLAALKPSEGAGVDFSGNMLARAKAAHPELRFYHEDVHRLDLNETFDYIVLSDLINDVEDVQRVFEIARNHSHQNTRIILNFYSHLWSWPLALAQKINWATRTLPQNWLTKPDVKSLMKLAGLEHIRSWNEVLWPVKTPFIDRFFNRYLAHLWPFNWFALTNFMVARPQPSFETTNESTKVSVVIAARNEEGHIAELIQRTPDMGTHTELIFVEGGSSDNTYQAIETHIAANKQRDIKLLKQPGTGKGDAVRHGFAHASGDIFMILDADMTVSPEDLTRFYNAITSGKGEYINGVRLVYPLEQQSMRFLNLIGNKFFSLVFYFLLGQPIKDCLCGTKVLSKNNYQRIAANRNYFGDFDPFGDFDLIFGAAKLNLKSIDLPVRYKQRRYGETNISRWSHGWLLLKMVIFAARRVKFV